MKPNGGQRDLWRQQAVRSYDEDRDAVSPLFQRMKNARLKYERAGL
jgi:hypothetical protein